MTTEQYLGQLEDIDRKIKNKLRESRDWYDMAIGSGIGTGSPDRVQTSPDLQRMATAVAKYMDYSEEASKLAQELSQKKRLIIRQMEQMTPLHYAILYGKFMEHKNFTELGNEESYSPKQIKRHYYTALSVFEDKYGDTYLDNKSAKDIDF